MKLHKIMLTTVIGIVSLSTFHMYSDIGDITGTLRLLSNELAQLNFVDTFNADIKKLDKYIENPSNLQEISDFLYTLQQKLGGVLQPLEETPTDEKTKGHKKLERHASLGITFAFSALSQIKQEPQPGKKQGIMPTHWVSMPVPTPSPTPSSGQSNP